MSTDELHEASTAPRHYLNPYVSMAKAIRGLSAGLNASGRYKFRNPEFEVDYLVVGGGVVGLAIARELSLKRPTKSTYLLERHTRTGEETSSRNSEVIHAGFYYPLNSYKTRLCLTGRRLLYDYCDSHAVPYKKTGKLVVSHEHQRDYLENLYKKTQSLRWSNVLPKNSNVFSRDKDDLAVPARLLSGDEARELEPDLSRDIISALHSTETGIIDVHTYMEALEKDISESDAGSVVCSTKVVRVDATKAGWVVQMSTDPDDASAQTDSVLAKTLINSSGLSAPFILNGLGRDVDPPVADIPIYYARGSYGSYRGPGVANIKHLIYPVPETGANKHGFAGLGTHLTLDLGGNVKFGPDIEWIEPRPSTSDDEAIDFWMDHLVASQDTSPMFQSVRSYLPGIEEGGLHPDYVGIRPKLAPPGTGFQDFVFRRDHSGAFMGGDMRKDEGAMMISLLGIESPGLTSSLAIAQMIEQELLHKDID